MRFEFSIHSGPCEEILRRASTFSPGDERQALVEVLGGVLAEGEELGVEFARFHVERLDGPGLLLPEAIEAGHMYIRFKPDDPQLPRERARLAHRITRAATSSVHERVLRLFLASCLMAFEPEELVILLKALEISPAPSAYLLREIGDHRISVAQGVLIEWSRGHCPFPAAKETALPHLRSGMRDLEEAKRLAPWDEHTESTLGQARRLEDSLVDETKLTALFAGGDMG